MIRAWLLGLLLLGACSPTPAPRDAELSCEVGTMRLCGCGLDGLDGTGQKRCIADGFRGIYEACRCDAGAD